MARRPPDVLITTPESLFLMLTSATRSILAGVESVIIDEVHAIAGSKRGAHLAVSLARLDRLAGRRIPRVGLSATVRPHTSPRTSSAAMPRSRSSSRARPRSGI